MKSNHVIKFIEAIEGMMDIANHGSKVDAIISDIPFGTTNCKWDSVIDLKKFWYYTKSIRSSSSIPVILFAQTPFDKVLGSSNIDRLRYEWIWEKTKATGHLNSNKMPLKAHENILVFYDRLPTYNPQKTTGHEPVNSFKKDGSKDGEIYRKTSGTSGGGQTDRFPRSVIKFPSDTQKSSLHPTQKPIALMEYLVSTYTNAGDTVLDITCGSGTTNLACKNLGRNSIGFDNGFCEKDKIVNGISLNGLAWTDVTELRLSGMI